MKKAICFAMALLLCVGLPTEALAASTLVSTSVVLMDADTGEILYSKNRNKKMYPASITKIMTGLLAMEHSKADEIITVKKTAASSRLPKGYAHIALSAGEKLSMDTAMYAIMLPSANDAANAIAEHVAGSQSKFIAMMNQRAKDIGAVNTNFANTNGIPNNKHYTTAYDMALITRTAYRNKRFAAYFGADTHTLPATNKQKSLDVENHHYMLLPDKEEYDASVVGGKIGYTSQSGHTMCTVAVRDGRTLICVVMGSTSSGKYSDTERLFRYGFSQ